MARIYLSTNHSLWGMFVDVTETSYSIANNTSEVTAKLYLYRTSSSSYYGGRYNYSITIDGTNKTGSDTASYPTDIGTGESNAHLLGTKTYTVGHNSDGTKTANVSASFSAEFNPTSASGSGNVTLTTIPRYASLSHSVSSKTVDTFTVSWSSDSTCDYMWYSIDNGSNWTGIDIADGKSGSYTATNLVPNNTYYVKTRIRRKDSQLNTTSDTLTIKTNNIATITGANDFTDEGNPYFTFSNPSGGSISISLEYSVTSPIYSKSIWRNSFTSSSSGNYTVSLTNAERVALRQENIKNGNNYLTVRYVVVTPSPSGKHDYTHYVDKTMTVINADPDFSDFQWWGDNKTLELVGTTQAVIKDYTTITTYINNEHKAIAKKEATITSYQTNIGTKSAKYNNPSTYPVSYDLSAVNGATIEVYANDNRGNSNVARKPIQTYIEYSPLTYSPLDVIRTEQINSETRLTFRGTIDLLNFGAVQNGVLEAKYYYKESTDKNDYTESKSGTLTPTFTEYQGSVYRFTIDELIRGDLGTEGFDINKSYLIKVVVRDSLSVITDEFVLGTGSPAIAIHKNCVALGGRYDETIGGRVQINGISYDALIRAVPVELTFSVSGLSVGDFPYAYTSQSVPTISGMKAIGVVMNECSYADKNYIVGCNFRNGKIYGVLRVGYKTASDPTLSAWGYIIYASRDIIDDSGIA